MDFENRYRLYIDESGDHVFNQLDDPNHRYLCLLGCWFRNADYAVFHEALEAFKRRVIPHSPDDPLILHREDILRRRKAFYRLRDAEVAEAFDAGLLKVMQEASFRLVAVVIDKKRLFEKYPTPAHPYHLAMGFLLQRYCGYLNHISRTGDVLAESRGGAEDRLLKDSYERVYERGIWQFSKSSVQRALTSRELKLKPKSANTAGLQLCDLLGHPVKQAILIERGYLPSPLPPFAQRIVSVTDMKVNRHLYDGRVDGYGKVLFPV